MFPRQEPAGRAGELPRGARHPSGWFKPPGGGTRAVEARVPSLGVPVATLAAGPSSVTSEGGGFALGGRRPRVIFNNWRWSARGKSWGLWS